MKILLGALKGTILKVPKDGQTRPTSAKTREALMNMLDLDFPSVSVLEPFGGSGALSLEVLSQGARKAFIIEKKRETFKLLKGNVSLGMERLQKQGFPTPNVIVKQGDCLKILPSLPSNGYGLIFLDPPYGVLLSFLKSSLPQILRLLAPNGVLVVEFQVQDEGELAKFLEMTPLVKIKQKAYKDTGILIFEKAAE